MDTILCTHYQDRREPFRHLPETFGCSGLGVVARTNGHKAATN